MPFKPDLSPRIFFWEHGGQALAIRAVDILGFAAYPDTKTIFVQRENKVLDTINCPSKVNYNRTVVALVEAMDQDHWSL